MTLDHQPRKSTNPKVALLAVVVAAIVVSGLLLLGASTQSAKSTEYKSQVAQLKGINTSYQNLCNQYFNAPSSISRQKADWDTYYSGISAQIQTFTSTLSGQAYSDSRLTKIQQDIAKGLNDFSSIVILDQSNIDMQFKVSSDKATITSDKKISAQEADFSGGYVSANQTQLASDNATLADDQKTFDEQTAQLKTLTSSLSNSNVQLQNEINRAELAS